MALDHTIAGLRTALDSVNTAIQAGDWVAAYKAQATYALTYAGLAQTFNLGSMSATLPAPSVLSDTIRMTQEAVQRAGKRVIHTRVKHAR